MWRDCLQDVKCDVLQQNVAPSGQEFGTRRVCVKICRVEFTDKQLEV